MNWTISTISQPWDLMSISLRDTSECCFAFEEDIEVGERNPRRKQSLAGSVEAEANAAGPFFQLSSPRGILSKLEHAKIVRSLFLSYHHHPPPYFPQHSISLKMAYKVAGTVPATSELP